MTATAKESKTTLGRSDQVSSTRSVGMSLARPFKAGARAKVFASRSDAGNWRPFQSSLRDETRQHLIPALKRRAKLIPTLRAEDLFRASLSLSRRYDKLKLI